MLGATDYGRQNYETNESVYNSVTWLQSYTAVYIALLNYI